MAVTRTVNMLPAVFQTESNKKFLNATLDQLVTEPKLKRINGYVGRKFSPTYASGDNYIEEPSPARQNYQLEPSVIVKNKDTGDVDFHASYVEVLQKLKFYGSQTADYNSLWENEYYTFNPRIDLDKFINFGQYYWLPDGPDSVDVYAGTVDLDTKFIVTADEKTSVYNFSETFQTGNPDLILARGGTYQFAVDQPGHKFWIQSDPGVAGTVANKNNLSSRDVLGVSNNGAEQGIIAFAVPAKSAQDFYISLPKLQDIDFVTKLPYVNIQGQLLSSVLASSGGFDGQTTALNNRYLIFINDYLDDVFWTVDSTTIPVSQRYGVWQISLTPSGVDDFIISLNFITDIPINNKVNVKSGLEYGSTDWFKNPIGKLELVPLITANLDTLYYQDSVNPDQVGIIRLVDVGANNIDVDLDILGNKQYISPNGVTFTNGLKVQFDASVLQTEYAGKEFYVEGVGKSIRLVPVTDLRVGSSELSIELPDYTAVNRSSVDNNPWSRHNRWFHKDVIRLAAQYNNTIPTYDQDMLAKRPIIEFEPDLQLYNFGRSKKKPVDIYDTTITNPFISVEGVSATYIDGTLLTDGMRIIFSKDADSRTRNKIWVVNFEDIVDDNPDNNNNRIVLTLADDGEVVEGDTVIVYNGVSNNGKSFWFNGVDWLLGQQKTSLHQPPLFDVFDSDGSSFSDESKYPTVGNGGFAGNKIFSYGIGTGAKDTVLGIPLAYKNFNQIGDIKFDNNFDSESFSYIVDTVSYPAKVNSGFLKKYTNGSAEYINTWQKVNRTSVGYQNFSYEFDGINNSFYIDVTPRAETSIPNLIVYANAKKLNSRQWRKIAAPNGGYRIYVATNYISAGDRVDIFVNSDSVSSIGFYQIPPNLDLNAENKSFTELTLGTLRNHISSLVNNSLSFNGSFPGISNLRDIDVSNSIGTILQHSAPATFSALFLANETTSLVDSVNFAAQEYTRFKNKFLELSVSDTTLNYRDIPGTVDTIIKKINSVKNKSFPWYYSDMIPYNDQKNIIEYNIFNPSVKRYEITSIFDDSKLSNTGIIVYLNGEQLVKDRDYNFSPTSPAIELSDNLTLAVDDTLKIIEYTNTDGCWIPETPTKLGLYPKSIPEIYTDYTFITPVVMIKGHDGSLTPAFGDFRDDLILEFETRIYNNIKMEYNRDDFDLFSVLPGKFRNSNSSLNDFTVLIGSSFMRWCGSNRLDYSTNTNHDSSNDQTWNFRESPDIINRENLPGTWRACFQYFYDTQYPNTRPWEMLGFANKPSWWEDTYGPAPYTSGNTILWTDLQNGYIAGEDRIDTKFVRPGLLNFIPVTENGELRTPYGLLSVAVNPNRVDLSYALGNYGPVELAWRNSSEYPYAVQIAAALTKPAKYFGININKQKYNYNSVLQQYLVNDTNQRIVASDIVIHGSKDSNGTLLRSAGYLNWIGDYQRHFGIDPTVTLAHYVRDYSVQLSYRMAGYSDKKYLKVYAEQHSPNSINDSIIIPDSDYDLILNKSTPVQKVTYSAVIIEKSAGGYKISGYDTNRPYFVVVPPDTAGNAYNVQVLDDVATIYSSFKSFKVSVPYGYEFSTKQQVVNFLTGYGLALTAAGFRFDQFDQNLGQIRDWVLSAKEFLFWAKQKWAQGSVLVVSPVAGELRLTSDKSVVDRLDNSIFGSRIANQNFEILTNESYSVTRAGNLFTVALTNNQTICLADLNLVQYEHALILNNTTMFSDTVYQPELGSRQFRLKLAGFKTGEWNGNIDAQGFIYNNTTVPEWQAIKDYLKGELVQYKGLYYVANENIPGSSEFDFSHWKQIDKQKIKTGLLNNFSTNSKISEQFYDVDGVNLESQYDLFGKGLIGYRNRNYLNDLDLDDTSQVKFYQGYIKSKGTLNALDALTSLASNNIASDISFKEEWAFRVGEYGSLETNQFIEVDLSDITVIGNPYTLEFNNGVTDSVADLVINEPYNFSAEVYNPSIFLNRQQNTPYVTDLQTAGFVHFDDIDYTVFDLNDYSSLNNNTSAIGSGTLIWCAKDFDSNWNVYRVSETKVQVISISIGLDQTIILSTNNPHNLAIDDVVLLKSGNMFEGFYRINKVPSLTSFTVSYAGNLTGFQNLTGLQNQLLYLHSVKFSYASDIASFVPRDGWRTTERSWVESDSDSKWAVYEKSEPWQSIRSLTAGETVENGKYGSSVALGKNNNFAVVGQPGVDSGRLISYVLGFDNQLTEDFVIQPTADNTSEFGLVIGQGTDFTVVGAPGSVSDSGYAYILKRLANSNLVMRQVIAAPDYTSGDRFGEVVAISDDDQWIYISSPAADKVYVYGYRHDTIDALYSITGDDSETVFTLGFAPESAESITVISNDRTYVPNIEYTVSGNEITFSGPLAAGVCAIQQYAGYRYVTTISGTAGSGFGSSLATTTDGAQLIVGAPTATVDGFTSAGAVHIYDRSIESFIVAGTEVIFNTMRPQSDLTKVFVNGELQSRSNTSTDDPTYERTADSRIIRFFNELPLSSVVTIETNEFNLLETLSASTPSTGSQFGYSVDICPSNCSVYVGSPYYDNEAYNIGAVYRFVNQGRAYGTILGGVEPSAINSSDSIRINDFEIQFTSSSIADIVSVINSKNIPGITAYNENNYLRIVSDSTISANKLRILPGEGSAVSKLGLSVFEQTQVITHPLEKADEIFGQKVKIDDTGTTLLVGSTVAITYEKTTFDNQDTTVDHSIDNFVDPILSTGAVYVLNYLSDTRQSIEHAGKFVYNQQLDPIQTTLSTGGKFGVDFYARHNQILVGASCDNKITTNGGRVYHFTNSTGLTGWDTIRTQSDKVDISSILKFYLYDKKHNVILEPLDYIDPAKGKIAGEAEQEITYRTMFDPAVYNAGVDTDKTITNINHHWSGQQLGQVWWDLNTVRFIEYEQDSLVYRSSNWGRTFPGSSIDVYEWVESSVLPSRYISNGGDGVPKHIDDSAYVQTTVVDSSTNLEVTKYYFWVKDKTSVEQSVSRTLPVVNVKQLIENPVGQGIKHVAAIRHDAVSLFNIQSDVNGKNTVLHIDYATELNDSAIHTEWSLLGENTNDVYAIPYKILNKVIDSLSGIDAVGNPVPDPLLPVQQRYGISIRPRQGIFVTRNEAAKVAIQHLNRIFSTLLMRQSSNLDGLYFEEPIPPANAGYYDLVVSNFETLGFVNIVIQPVGYKVLVENNSNANGLWSIYTKTAANTWFLSRVQAYKVPEYWSFIDWFATGYDESVVPDFVVNIPADLSTLTLKSGDIIKIKNDGTGNWKIVRILPYVVETIGVQNGTIELSSKLYDYESAGFGYDNDTFDTIRFDQNPSLEIRSLINTIINDVLVNDLSPEAINLLFALVNYALTEQKYVDWAFKTSFVSVLHKLRKLTQPAVFIRDNQDYYEQYIEEVKPYHTTVREYVLDYQGVDNINGYVTDFDLTAYYDPVLKLYRSPSGEYSQDTIALQNPAYNDWKNYYSYRVEEIVVADGGSDYTIAPIVTITGSYTRNNATGRAVVSGGKVTSIILDTAGSDYTSIPTVTLTGGNGTGARAYARLTNGLVRGMKTTLTFDRLTYGTSVGVWDANTAYTAGEIISFNGTAYQVTSNFTSGSTFDGNNLETYKFITDTSKDWTANTIYVKNELISYSSNTYIVTSDFTSNSSFDTNNLSYYTASTANDRIQSYYAPTPNQPGLDFAQLQSGIDYPGVQILGPLFSYNPAFDSSTFENIGFDSFDIGPDGTIQLSQTILDTIIQSQYDDSLLGTRPEDINIDGGQYVDTYSSHAPEELVPGIVFDTMDIQVFQTITADSSQDFHSCDIQFVSHEYTGSTTVFEYKSPAFNDVLFVYSMFNGALIRNTDYTVNYFDKTVDVTRNLLPGDTIFIYSFNQVGSGKINEVTAEGNGTETSFNAHMPYSIIGSCLVLVDGERVTDFTIENTSPNATIEFDSPPSAGSYIHIINYRAGSGQQFSEIHEELHTVSSLAPAYPTDYTITLDRSVFNEIPLDAHMIVEWDDKRLRPATNVYYTADGYRTIYPGPDSANDINNDSILNTDIKVYVDGELQTEVSDYTVPPSTTGAPDVTFVSPVAAGSTICISITKHAEFELSSANTIVLSSSLAISTNDVIKVITFSNHDDLGMETTVYVGNQTTVASVVVGFSTIPFEDIGFDSDDTVTLVEPKFEINTTILNQNYCWVTLNGRRLIPNFDFIIQGRFVVLADQYPLSATDVLIVTTFSTQTLGQPMGFRIFKDMVGTIEYLRLDQSSSTTLAQDLAIDDTEIVVEDASVLPSANPTIAHPGIVFINGERITYYQVDLNTNTLSQIRRGTAGTGANVHYAGTRVVDCSAGQSIPQTDNYTFTPNANVVVTTNDANGNISADTYTLLANVTYTRGNVWYSAGNAAATNGLGLATSTTIQANFLKAAASFLP